MKPSFGALWSEFKAFAFKGNMLDLAVAVVIGAAFGKVVTAMVDDIVMPAISYAVTAASTAKEASTTFATEAVKHAPIAALRPTSKPTTSTAVAPAGSAPLAKAPAPPAVAAAPLPPPPAAKPAPKPDPTKAVQFDLMVGRFKIGDFVGSLLNFIIVAFAVFIMIVKLLGTMMQKVAGSTPAPSEPTTKECPMCLSVIPIKAIKCSHCTADLPVMPSPETPAAQPA